MWRRRARGVVPPAACIAGLALASWAVYGLGFTGYDSMFALAWGEDLAHLRDPRFEGSVHPTPHPLTILVGAALAPLGPLETAVAFQLLALGAFAGLGWAAFKLGQSLFTLPVGLLLAVFLLTRPFLAAEALEALVDVPFLALVIAAMALEARTPRSGVPVLILLAIAGLLRPEAWLLSAGYAVYLFPRLARAERAQAVALALSAPVVWTAMDLIITGDPLYSLHGTRELAERIARPRGLGNALDLLPHHLDRVLRTPLVWLGLAGTLLALTNLYRRALLPAAVLALGLGSFLVLGLAGLPLLQRYLIVPSAVLALFAAVALAGWSLLPRGRLRSLWIAGAVPLAAWLVLSAPGDVRELDRLTTFVDQQGRAQRDLLRLGGGRKGQDLLERCEPVAVPGGSLLPALVFLRERRAHGLVGARGVPRADARLAVAAAGPRPARLLGIAAGTGAAARVLGMRPAARNGSWVFYARC